ncbi:glycoside hydrolase family 31 protein [Aquibacillus rhizosphaerae]|uniref:Glycoside hydrolase family 31 protein n=1 Tax=Aquibacillus rhizosphaerae TaxID=3051431 RepID=A0ABT7L3E6_9BACI|nr:glycoside hydrolase family 31 protein [Aquibacillus sp. LR5S19]MDL4840369.1 glycoside hydrolase family 31 protein [Aquibacillus sp. LR5S19]
MLQEKHFSVKTKQQNTISFSTPDNDVVELYILEQDTFRVYVPTDNHPLLNRTWSVAPGMEDVPVEGRDKFDLSPFSLPSYQMEEKNNTVEISTNELKVIVNLKGFQLNWYGKFEGKWINIANDRKTQSYNFDDSLGEGVFHYLERPRNDHYYGLGEKGGSLDKKGKRYRMLNIDAMGYDAEHTDPLYKHMPFYITYNDDTEMAYGLYYDNYSDSVFDMGAELDNYHGHYRYYQAKRGNLDYYFILGPRIKEVVEKFTRFSGQMIMPPKWSLGYSGSTMTYTDAPDAQEQLKKFVEACKDYNIPCDSFQLSSGYTSIGNKRYVFNWDLSRIPDPKEMINNFHENKINLCANIKPVLLHDHPLYEQLKQLEYFVKSKDGKNPEVSQFWDEVGSYIDFTNKAAYDWWKDKVKEQLLDLGIDSTWNDNNEYEIWDEDALANGFGEVIPVSYIKPIQTLLMMKASYEAQIEHAPNTRPYLISRSGIPGMQRYVQTWSGDNYTEWKTIRYNIKMGLGLSMSGMYNFGHDVGGFSGNAPDPELFIRWIQNGIFHPRFTIHSWNDDKTVNVPWMYPDHIDTIRQFMEERVKWIPYLYHLLHKANKDYQPMLTPTLYYFDHDAKTFEENDDFLVGEDLLICNVVEKGATKRKVYLPDNKRGWYDINSGSYHAGGTNLEVDAPIDVIPMFAQAGAMLPIRDGEINFVNKEEDSRGLLMYPTIGVDYTTASVYEDDGESLDYQNGEFAYINTSMKTTNEQVEVSLSIEGKYNPPYNNVTLYFPEEETRTVIVNGQQVDINEPFQWNIK